MKPSLIFTLLLIVQSVVGQVVLNADGPGDTYELISSVLAPGYNPIEVPDCNHEEFGRHIEEVFDDELNKYVFKFHIHTEPDNDRCINFDRQRNEIKTYDKSPDHLLGIENETVVYKWKFKLPLDYQVSPKFCHIHQLKSVGGNFSSQPMYTLTTRKGTPDKMQLYYAETDDSDLLKQTDIAPFIDTWVEVTETITYGVSGSFHIEIKRVSDQELLFEHYIESNINWRPDADFVRPKWGIYRSLDFSEDLRDETVLFSDFSIEEVTISSSNELEKQKFPLITFNNPAKDVLFINDRFQRVKKIEIFNLDGKKVLEEIINSKTKTSIDVSLLAQGLYLLKFSGNKFNQADLILIN